MSQLLLLKKTKLPDCHHYKGGEIKISHSSPSLSVPSYKPTSYTDAVINGRPAHPSNVSPLCKDAVIGEKEDNTTKSSDHSPTNQPCDDDDGDTHSKLRHYNNKPKHSPTGNRVKSSDFYSVNRFQCLGEMSLDSAANLQPSVRIKKSVQNPPKVKTTFVTQNVKPVKDAAPNYLDLFAAFVNQNDPQPVTPQQDAFNAKHYLINETSDELIIGDSHISRLLNNLGKYNQSSFLVYPGVVLTKQEEFTKISDDINHVLLNENVQIKKIVLSFGGNDVQSWLQSNTINDDLQFVSDPIVKGDVNIDWSDVNPSDPLNLFHGSHLNYNPQLIFYLNPTFT